MRGSVTFSLPFVTSLHFTTLTDVFRNVLTYPETFYSNWIYFIDPLRTFTFCIYDTFVSRLTLYDTFVSRFIKSSFFIRSYKHLVHTLAHNSRLSSKVNHTSSSDFHHRLQSFLQSFINNRAIHHKYLNLSGYEPNVSTADSKETRFSRTISSRNRIHTCPRYRNHIRTCPRYRNRI